MKRRIVGLSLVLLAGCRGSTENFARLDVADPSLASGWAQFRHEPGGYSFQAPVSWVLDPQDEAQAHFAKSGSDVNLFLRIVDLAAARKNDLVSFAVTRLSLPDSKEIKVTDLDDLGKKALEGMKKSAPDARRERLQLAIGAAEHVWGTIDKVHADGTHESYTSHLVIFATALRPFVLMYGYPTKGQSEYGPKLDAILRTVRLTLPKEGGQVVIPATAHAPAAAPSIPAQNGFGAGGFTGSSPQGTASPVPEPNDAYPAPAAPPTDPTGGGGPPASDPMPPVGEPGQAPPPEQTPPATGTTGGEAPKEEPGNVPPPSESPPPLGP